MKKILLVFGAAMAIALTISACASTQECPAYSQAATNVEAIV